MTCPNEKRHRIGIVKVYRSVKNGVITYETVWPLKLYRQVRDPTSSAQIKAQTAVAWAKSLASQRMTLTIPKDKP